MVRTSWLALSYNVPINPSKARVYVWRKLKECGAEYLRQGIAVLPNSAQSMQKFATLAQKIRQMEGEATIVEMRFVDAADEQEMTTRFQNQIEAEYRELLGDCAHALQKLHSPETHSPKQNEQLRRMVKRYRQTRARDCFGGMNGASQEIEAGLNELVDSVRGVASDFGKQLRVLLDG